MQPDDQPNGVADAIAEMCVASGMDLARAGTTIPANDDAAKPDVFLERAKALIEKHRKSTGVTGRMGRPVRRWGDFRAEMARRPEPQWLIEGILEEQSVGAVVGQPKACKSWFGIDAALAVATGIPLMGEPTMATRKCLGKTAVFNTENSGKALERRALALIEEKREAHIGDPNEFDDRLNENFFVFERQSMNLTDDADLAALIAELLEHVGDGLRLLVLDPFRDLFDVEDEKDNTQMGRAIDRMRLIRDALGCSVMVVHHAKKTQGVREFNVREMARGGNAFVGKMDSVIGMGNPRGPDKQHLVQDMLVVVRDGQSAESKTVTLAIEDDEKRHAKRARWYLAPLEERGDANKPMRPKAEEKAITVEGRITAFLASHDGPAGLHAIRAAVGGGTDSLRGYLERLTQSGKVARGERGGWTMPGAVGTTMPVNGTAPHTD